MARRQINNLRTVTEVVAETPNQWGQVAADIGEKIVVQSQEAKMTENMSAIQLELNGLNNQFRIENESDPMGSIEKYKEARKEIYDKYSTGISSFFMNDWEKSLGRMTAVSDAKYQAWAYGQSYKNTVTSFNGSISNFLKMASADGENFGSSDASDLEAFVNFAASRKELEEFGAKNLGAETTKKALGDFDNDYMKTFVSGVVETNPAKALKLMETKEVQDSFDTPEQFTKFRTAIENRAKRVDYNTGQRVVLGGLSRDNAPLNQSSGQMNYVQLQQGDFSPAAREYYENLNGFTGSGKRGGFTPEDKAGLKTAIFDNVQKLIKDKDMDAQSVRVVQDSIYKAMNKGAITQAEGQDYLKQIVAPLIVKKEESMAQFQEGDGVFGWFKDDLGFNGIQDFAEKQQLPTAGLNKSTRRAVDVQNANARANLYDYYMGALQARAGRLGVPVASITDLPAIDRKKIYAEAQSEAQRLFLQDKHPQLRTLPDTPNFVYSKEGQLIPGMTGNRNLKSTGTAKANFKVQIDDRTGEYFRVYDNGTIEPVKGK